MTLALEKDAPQTPPDFERHLGLVLPDGQQGAEVHSI